MAYWEEGWETFFRIKFRGMGIPNREESLWKKIN